MNCVQLVEDDKLVGQGTRKSPRKVSNKNLPIEVRRLIVMADTAKLRAAHNRHTSTSNKTSRKQKAKSVRELLISDHQSEFREILSNMVLSQLLCPLCNHQSLIALNTKEEVDKANSNIKENFQRRVKDWESKGKSGGEPRMGKTESQILGCCCYMQNCIGNNDGKGCFKCFDMKGEVGLMHDPR